MLHLKQIQRNLSDLISRHTLALKRNLKSLGVAVQNFPYQESLGMMLLSLVLLINITAFLIVTCTLNLLYVMTWMWMTLKKQLQSSVLPELWHQFTSWLWAVRQKVTSRTENKLQNLPSKQATDIAHAFMSTSSETPGEPKNVLDLDKVSAIGL